VTRDPGRAATLLPPEVELVGADPSQPGVWQDRMLTCDAVVNLAGESVARGRWGAAQKRRIRRSRLAVTSQIAQALDRQDGPTVLVSASAVGYYGDCGGEALTENHEAGHDFLARVAVEWEHAAALAVCETVRVVVMRFGVVLAPEGGALARMVPVFRRGLGGALGSGQQYFPWVHIDDAVEAVLFVLGRDEVRGPVNVAAADPPPQRVFAEALGCALGKSARAAVPPWALKLVLGAQSSLVLGSQRAVPNVLKAHGFRFVHGELERALADLLPGATSAS